jgi:hypothetical protein
MGLSITLALLLAFQPPPADASPRVELSASSLTPYVSEEVRLNVDLWLPLAQPGDPPRLTIHWLKAEHDWSQQPEDWRRLYATQPGRGGVQLNDEPGLVFPERIFDDAAAGASKLGHFRLTWKLAAPTPDDVNQGRLRFGAVKMASGGKSLSSPPLELTLRPVPPSLKPIPRVNLGVGDFSMKAEVTPHSLRFGDETKLTLRVFGTGALQTVPRPTPAQLAEALRPGDFLLEPAGDGWNADRTEREFRYHLRPRRADLSELPRIPYTCFEPGRGTYAARATGPITLEIRPAADASPTPPRASSPTQFPDRLGPVTTDANELLTRPSTWPSFPVLLALGLGPPLVFAGFVLFRWRSLSSNWRAGFQGQSAAAQRALAALRRADAAQPERLGVIVTRYLRARLHLTLPEPTPDELADHLSAVGIDGELRADLLQWWRDCIAGRFMTPDPVAVAELRRRALLLLPRLDRQP